MSELKMLDRTCSNGKQSLEYRSIWTLGTHKLRIRRDRDAYEFQSSAVIERWNGEQWKQVESIHYSNMASCQSDCYVVRDAARPNPAELRDEQELLRLATLVLL